MFVHEGIPAVHVSIGHPTQGVNKSRSRYNQTGTWSGFRDHMKQHVSTKVIQLLFICIAQFMYKDILK